MENKLWDVSSIAEEDFEKLAIYLVPDQPCDDRTKFSTNNCAASLPKNLVFRPSKTIKNVLGVWSNDYIPQGSRFGPLIGEIFDKQIVSNNANRIYFWRVYSGADSYHYIDGMNAMKSNWMRFVNPAYSNESQNLVACQVKQQIYFYTFKPVLPNQELLVWYCKDYAYRLNYPLTAEQMIIKIRLHLQKDIEYYRRLFLTNEGSARSEKRKQINGYVGGHVLLPDNNYVLDLRVIKPKKGSKKNETKSKDVFLTEETSINDLKNVLPKQNTMANSMCQKFTDQLLESSIYKVKALPFHSNISNKSVESEFSLQLTEGIFQRMIWVQLISPQNIDTKSPFENNYSLPSNGSINGISFSVQLSPTGNSSKIISKYQIKEKDIKKCYECNFCYKKFGQSYSLKLHLRTHTGERPFKCSFCSKCFTQHAHLKRHLLLHKIEKQ